MYWIIQTIGYMAMACSITSIQQKTHKKILVFQALANTFFGIQYFALGAYVGAALNLVALIRSLIFFNHGKKWADHAIWPWVFCATFVLFGIFTYNLPQSVTPLFGFNSLVDNKDIVVKILPVIPVIGNVINTFSFASTNPTFTRITFMLSSPSWIIYSFISGSWGAFINECFTMTSTIIAIIRFDVLKKVKSTQKQIDIK